MNPAPTAGTSIAKRYTIADERYARSATTREVDRLGSTAARLKLKGIDGDPHKRWMMWFNLIQCEKFYPPLICTEVARDGFVLEREP